MREAKKLLIDEGEQVLERIRWGRGGRRRQGDLLVEVHAVRLFRPRDDVLGLVGFDARVELNSRKKEVVLLPELNRPA